MYSEKTLFQDNQGNQGEVEVKTKRTLKMQGNLVVQVTTCKKYGLK